MSSGGNERTRRSVEEDRPNESLSKLEIEKEVGEDEENVTVATVEKEIENRKTVEERVDRLENVLADITESLGHLQSEVSLVQ